MFGRVSRLRGDPQLADDSVTYLQEKILPQASQFPIFAGVTSMVDRSSGSSMIITLWESEEAMRASEQEADRLREESAEASNQAIADVERYEVALFEVSD